MGYVIAFFGAALGCALNTVCGFGFGVVCMMFMPAVLGSTVQAATMINAVTCVQACSLAVRYRAHIRWRLLLIPLAAYLVSSALAVRVAVGLDNHVMKRILGAFLVLLSAWFIFIAKRVRIRAGTRTGLIAGAVGGVMSGMFATGGPPASLYFSATTETKEEYLATIQGYFAVTNLYVVALRAANGVVTGSLLVYTAAGLAGLLLGNVVGMYAFRRISVERMRQAIYVMMAVSGLLMLAT